MADDSPGHLLDGWAARACKWREATQPLPLGHIAGRHSHSPRVRRLRTAIGSIPVVGVRSSVVGVLVVVVVGVGVGVRKLYTSK